MLGLIIARAPRPSQSLENIHRLRISSSKITLDGREESGTLDPDDEKGSTTTLDDKNRTLRRSFSFSQRNFRRNAVTEPPGEGLSSKYLGTSMVFYNYSLHELEHAPQKRS